MTNSAKEILKILSEKYDIQEYYNEPFQVLIGTILSHRTKDENTRVAWRRLFAKYKSPGELAEVSESEIQNLIKPCGFYRIKAKRIKTVAKMIKEKYKGVVPKDMKALLSLPGVGRKTANCVLAFGFLEPAIPVDTHVHRISNRIGLVSTNTPDETEEELKKLFPKRDWLLINGLLVKFGQEICRATKPRCEFCPVKSYCKRR
jgi:endonuclease-3